MQWKKVDGVCKQAGNVSRQIVYDAVRNGRLRVARIGSGRNWITCDAWVDEWLVSTAQAQTTAVAFDAGAGRTRASVAGEARRG